MIQGDESALHDDAARIDVLADEFERARKSGKSPRIEDFLGRVAEDARPSALRELLNVEVELRRASQEQVSAKGYLDRFPGFQSVVLEVFHKSDVALENVGANTPRTPENDATHTHPASGNKKSSGRLEVRCPNCHAPTEVAVDTALTDLTCSACGSHFSLVDQSKATRMAPPLLQLGRFELIERLGVGGFGSVWKARDKELDRTVAIKIPRAGAMSPTEQEQFFREARAAAQLRHPSIVSVHEVGRDGDSIYIVSDYVRGVTLGDWLTGQQLTSREAAELCAKIADALHHAHEQGVVHRDLKPANIIMDYDGQPHLMDFGLARRDSGEITMTVDGQILGTPAYMSPEQAQGEAHTADRRSDVYSLGVILFQLLTCELPFRGNARMLIKQVIHDDPPNPRHLNSHIRKDLETVTLKCLEKDPSRRYQAAREFAEELRRFLADEPIYARPIGAPERAWRWCQRHPQVAFLSFLLLIVLVGASVISTWQAVRATRAEQQVIRERDQVLAEKEQKEVALLQKNQALAQAKHEERLAQERLATGLIAVGDANLALGQSEARDNYWEAQKVFRNLGLSELPATMGLLASYGQQSPPLIGADGSNTGVGGFEGHSAGWVSVNFSPDGQKIVSAGTDGLITIWDVKTGTPIRRFSRQKGSFYCATFSPDGHSILTAGPDNDMRLWDALSARPISTFRGHDAEVYSVAFSPDGSRAVSGSLDHTVRLWDVATGRELHRFEGPKFVKSVAISPDGRQVLAGGEPDTIALWDIETGQRMQNISEGTGSTITSVAFSPDGRTALSGSLGHGMFLWDLGTGKALRSFTGHTAAVRRVVFSSDGRHAFSVGYDRTTRLWDISTGQQIHQWHGHSQGICSAALSPDGRVAVTADIGGNIKLWKLQNETDISALRGHTDRVISLSPSSDARLLLSGSFDKTIRLWDAATGLPLRTISAGESPVWCVAISPDGQAALSSHEDGTISLWDVGSGARRRVLKAHNDVATAVAFSPDGQRAASAGSDSLLKVWNLETGDEIRTFTGHDSKVRAVAFSEDGRRLLSGAFDNTMKLWDVANGQVIHTFTGHKNWVHAIAFSPDGKSAASGGWDRRWGLWNLSTGKSLYFSPDSEDVVTAVAFSPDGKLLLTGSLDKTVRVWDIYQRQHVRDLNLHHDSVTSVVFCTDGVTAFSGSRDGIIRKWAFDSPARYAEFAQSLPQAREALTRDADNAKALVVFGEWYAFRGVYDWAAEFFEKAQMNGAKVSSLDLGRCYWHLGRHDNAARELRSAIQQQEAPTANLELCLAAIAASKIAK